MQTNQDIADAVANYWHTRLLQQKKQQEGGRFDQGARASVTGGAQMNGFINIFVSAIVLAGLPIEFIHHKRHIELPGYYRPTKEWDLVVVKNRQLLAAIETKSQAGPSFGNNFNNRTEEAVGSAVDLWTAFREGAFNHSTAPFLGYFFLLEDSPASRKPVKANGSHFNVFPEFINSSYSKRYEIFCRKLVRERQYTSSIFITSHRDTGLDGIYEEPAEDLSFQNFIRILKAHISASVEN